MNIELKPCPFCGAAPATNCFGSEGVFPEMACVICINEECASRPEVWGETEEAAAEAWNTRAERTCRMDYVGYIGTEESHASIYQCSKCNMRYMSANVPDPGEYCMKCGAKVVEG